MVRTFVLLVSVLVAAAPLVGQRSTPGTVAVTLTGANADVKGDYPTILCGGPYMLGQGMSWQTKAGDWQITVASENRTSGKVPLNGKDNGANVIVTANGPGMRYVRTRSASGNLTVSEDFKKAEGSFSLRNVVGKESATLTVTFTCQ